MAQGKLSNRQKMINLMYLIFIAMLAMNIDQEVLRSFASINETLTDVSVQTKASNENLYNAVEKQNDAASVAKAKEVKQKVDSFVAYVEGIKNVIAIKAKSNDEALNYNVLESSDKLNKFFNLDLTILFLFNHSSSKICINLIPNFKQSSVFNL